MFRGRAIVSIILIAAIGLRFSSSFACIHQLYTPNNEQQFQHKSDHLMSAWLESSEELEEEDSEGDQKVLLSDSPESAHRFNHCRSDLATTLFRVQDLPTFQFNAVYLLCRSWRL